MKHWEMHERIRLEAASEIWDDMREGHLFDEVISSDIRDVRLAMRAMKSEMVEVIENAHLTGSR